MYCISNSSIQILWNGEMSESFNLTRGIRQRDPLSPYIFFLYIERLAQIINKEVEKGEMESYLVIKRGAKTLPYFLCRWSSALCRASLNQVAVMNDCLEKFCVASSQKVSKSKSKIFCSKNVSSTPANAVSTAFGCPITIDLGKYLGVPIIHGRVKKEMYQDIAMRMNAKLKNWKVNTLSLARRIIIAQSVIQSLPTYNSTIRHVMWISR